MSIRRRWWTGLACALLLAGAAQGWRLAAPGAVIACSCVPAAPNAPIFSGDEEAVFVGTVGPGDGSGRFQFFVEQWFKGGGPALVLVQSAEMRLADGTSMIDTCGLSLVPGQRLVLTATRGDGALTPNNCLPHGAVDTPEGQVILEAADMAFGSGTVPVTPAPETPAPPTAPAVDTTLVAIVGGAALASLAIFAIVVLAVRRKRDAP